MPLLRGALPDRDGAEEAVVDVEHAAPRDGLRVDVQTREPVALLGGQRTRIALRGEGSD